MNLKNTLLFVIVLLLSRCSTQIELVNHFDTASPLNLTRGDTLVLEQETIDPNSEKYTKFIAWTKRNTNDWKMTPASYLSAPTIGQGDFRLSVHKSFVVLGYVDDGKAKQYVRELNPGELDFLFN